MGFCACYKNGGAGILVMNCNLLINNVFSLITLIEVNHKHIGNLDMTTNLKAYHRKGRQDDRIHDVIFTPNGTVQFKNGEHECELLEAQFNEDYEELI